MCLWEMTTACVSAVPWPWLGTSLCFFSQTPPSVHPHCCLARGAQLLLNLVLDWAGLPQTPAWGLHLTKRPAQRMQLQGQLVAESLKNPKPTLRGGFLFPFSAFSDKSPAIFVKSLSSLLISSLLHRSTYLINKSINGFLKLLSLTLEVQCTKGARKINDCMCSNCNQRANSVEICL